MILYKYKYPVFRILKNLPKSANFPRFQGKSVTNLALSVKMIFFEQELSNCMIILCIFQAVTFIAAF